MALASNVAARAGVSLLALGLAACSEGETEPPSTGGGGTEMGAAGSGGSSGSGGTESAGAGGGGMAGTQAMGGTGGDGSPGGDLLNLFDFTSDTQGWAFVYAEPASLIPTGADAGAQEGVAAMEHDPAEGNPDPGSLMLQLPFTGPLQKISLEVTIAEGDAGVDLSGRTLRGRIRLDSGLAGSPDFPAGIKLYVKSGPTSLYADGGWTNIDPSGEWQTVAWGVSGTPAYTDPAGTHDPSDVRQVGIEIATGDSGEYSPAVVHFDSFGY